MHHEHNGNDCHYCAVLTPLEILNHTSRAALLIANRWRPGQTITIKFMDGDAELRKRVERVAREWVAPNMANLKFDFRQSGNTDIRIAFQSGNGSWSYLGTQCRQIRQNEPTMNYGWLTPGSDETEVRRVVLHEFGHALGLIHEHQNPNQPIQWNREAVIRELSGPPNNWDAQNIEWNMFHTFPLAQVQSTRLDPLSIMMYSVPRTWTLDGFSTTFNSSLSAKDRQLIQQAYPHPGTRHIGQELQEAFTADVAEKRPLWQKLTSRSVG